MRLVLCDDHNMFLDALLTALTRLGLEIQAVTGHAEQVVPLVVQHQPEVCLLDVVFQNGSGLDSAALIRDRAPRVKVLILTGAATPEVWQAYDRRLVDGVVNKVCDLNVLQKSINRVANGDRVIEGWSRPSMSGEPQGDADTLTCREHQVLELIVDGATTPLIADELGITENTVRTHVQNILHKLGVHDRSRATRVALAMRQLGQRI